MEFELAPLLVGVIIGGIVGAGGKGLIRMGAKAGRMVKDGANRFADGVRDEWNEGIAEARQQQGQRPVQVGPPQG